MFSVESDGAWRRWEAFPLNPLPSRGPQILNGLTPKIQVGHSPPRLVFAGNLQPRHYSGMDQAQEIVHDISRVRERLAQGHITMSSIVEAAASHGDADTLDVLLSEGADPNLRSDDTSGLISSLPGRHMTRLLTSTQRTSTVGIRFIVPSDCPRTRIRVNTLAPSHLCLGTAPIYTVSSAKVFCRRDIQLALRFRVKMLRKKSNARSGPTMKTRVKTKMKTSPGMDSAH